MLKVCVSEEKDARELHSLLEDCNFIVPYAHYIPKETDIVLEIKDYVDCTIVIAHEGNSHGVLHWPKDKNNIIRELRERTDKI